MINAICKFLLKFWLMFMAAATNLLLSPITKFIDLVFPEFRTFTTTVEEFISTYMFPGIGFAKEVFINITGFPQTLITVICFVMVSMYSFVIGFKFIVAILNLWRLWAKGE